MKTQEPPKPDPVCHVCGGRVYAPLYGCRSCVGGKPAEKPKPSEPVDMDTGTEYLANTAILQLVREARHYVRTTIINLEQNYPNWNEAGKTYAVKRAVADCNEALRRLEFVSTVAKDCRKIPVDNPTEAGV